MNPAPPATKVLFGVRSNVPIPALASTARRLAGEWLKKR